MAECELLSKCLYFHDQLQNMPTASDMIKRMYCLWHYEDCARYKIAKATGSENVPPDLFPPDIERAEVILTCFKQTHQSP